MRTPYGDTPPDATTRIRDVRKEKRWTLDDLAERLRVTRQTIQRWETDGRKITVKNLIRVAEALDVSPRELLAGDDGLSTEERAMLDWWRSAPPHEKRGVIALTNSLSENRHTEFEVRKTGSD